VLSWIVKYISHNSKFPLLNEVLWIFEFSLYVNKITDNRYVKLIKLLGLLPVVSGLISPHKGKAIPGQALGVPGGWSSHISWQLAQESGKFVGPVHQLSLLPRKYSWYSFLLEAELTPRAIVQPEVLSQWQIPMTPSGIEPTTFQHVVQCLKKLHHHVLPIIYNALLKTVNTLGLRC